MPAFLIWPLIGGALGFLGGGALGWLTGSSTKAALYGAAGAFGLWFVINKVEL